MYIDRCVIENGVLYRYDGSEQNFNIPECVTKIGMTAFRKNGFLKNIVIPEHVTEVEYGAFEECLGLVSVEFKNPDTIIGQRAFGGCSELREVKLPASLKKIPAAMFEKCSKLQKIEIPDSVESIGNSAFNACFEMKEINFPPSLKSIGSFSLACCRSLTKLPPIPDELQIGDCAFVYCYGLADSNNMIIVRDIMYGVSVSPDVLVVPEGIKRLTSSNNVKSSKVVFPSTVTLIGRGCLLNEEPESIEIKSEEVIFVDVCLPPICRLKEIKTNCVIPEHAFLDHQFDTLNLHTVDIERLPENFRYPMLLGFLEKPEEYSQEEVEAYKKYVRDSYQMVAPLAMDNDNIFNFCIDNRLIDTDSFEFWTETAMAVEDIEKTAVLLSYKKEIL